LKREAVGFAKTLYPRYGQRQILKIKSPTRFPGRAQFSSFNFPNNLICPDASTAPEDAVPARRNRAMKDEYDFSKAERGKIFRPDAQLIPPLHLDPEVLSYLAERAEARGTSLNELVNALLRKDIEIIEVAKQDSPTTGIPKCRLK
jgi:hypothetical protein